MADKILKKLNIKVWRQNNASAKGKFETYTIENISMHPKSLILWQAISIPICLNYSDLVSLKYLSKDEITLSEAVARLLLKSESDFLYRIFSVNESWQISDREATLLEYRAATP